MTKRFTNLRRLDAVEDRGRESEQRINRTADRTPKVGRHQIIYLAKTVSSPSYPSAAPGRYPIVFLHGTFDNSAPAEGNATYFDGSASAMEYAHSEVHHEPDTVLQVFNQDGRWWILNDKKGSSSEIQEYILLGIATCTGNNPFDPCADTIQVTDLEYRPFGIFQKPWDTSGGSPSGWGFANNDQMQYANGDLGKWSVGLGETFNVENPAKICAKEGDKVLLHYTGSPEVAVVLEVLHECFTVNRLWYDPFYCTLKSADVFMCSPTSEPLGPFPPQGPNQGRGVLEFTPTQVVTDVAYNSMNCEVFQTVQSFCMLDIPLSEPTQIPIFDFNDIEDPCCPCITCPDDCTRCSGPLTITLEGWSQGDCDCMDYTLAMDNFPSGSCKWNGEENDLCLGSTGDAPGSIIADIECIGDDWILTVYYSTVGNWGTDASNNVYVRGVANLGPGRCPPKGSFPIFWTYEPFSYQCMGAPTTVLIQ